jgi:site-specific DNA-methyltransferase (adenine-specific)
MGQRGVKVKRCGHDKFMDSTIQRGQSIDPFIDRVIHGDCIDVMRQMPRDSIDFVLTDPPYIVDYRSRDGRTIASDNRTSWLKPAFAECFRVLKPDRYCVSFYGWTKVELFMEAWRATGFTPVGHLVFVKEYASSSGHLRYCHESAYLLAKGRPERPAWPLRDVLRWRYSGNTLHPTQKPLVALLPLIRAFTKSGDIVLDPFAGSASTAVAAQALGRRYIAIEKIWRYYRIANRRISALEESNSLADYHS